ncbi:hypothetical protein F5H01DRAFT_334894 [Linnemannia elongata]|nr:hypothetical protein F5H01DRAFT_334894 [Linnemannia elongata]
MRPQLLFIALVFLSYAVAAPFIMPSQQSMNSIGSSFSRSLRSWSNRGFNHMDDTMLCQEYITASNGGVGEDSQWMSQNRRRIRQNTLDFKLNCLAQQRTKQGAEASMNLGSKTMDSSSKYNNSLENKDYGTQGGGDYGQQQQGGYDDQQQQGGAGHDQQP